MKSESLSFDIDVDLAPLLDGNAEPLVVSGSYYDYAQPLLGRSVALQQAIDRDFRNAMLEAQWRAAKRRLERRRNLRAPILSRLHSDGPTRLLACDISLDGLRCSGRPGREVMDVEFKLPGLAFPVEARAEVVTFKDNNVIPLAGLRFVDIDPPYLEHIGRYVDERRRASWAA